MKKSLYDKLGVDKNASKDEIKNAYRKKAKENHPDAGGDKEVMSELAETYSILSNDKKRAKYDATGETKETPFGERFMGFINEIFVRMIEEEGDVVHKDLIKAFQNKAKVILNELIKAKQKQERSQKKFAEVLTRLKSKNNKHVFMVLESKQNDLKQSISQYEDEIEFINKCIDALKSYYYDFEQQQEPPQPNTFSVGGFSFTID
jgi:curved DNA-binding protein CbpA